MKIQRKIFLRAAVAAAALCVGVCARANTVTEEPDALLDYIEADGSQYIDTEVNAETGLKARIDLEMGNFGGDTTDWGFLDAADPVTTVSDNRSRIFMCHMYNSKPFFGYGLKQRGNPSGSFKFVSGQRYEIVTDMTDTNSLEVVQNGRKTFSAADWTKYATNGVVNLHRTLYVFATNYGGAPKWYGEGKLYELKIWKKNAETGELDLIRHYLPCIKGGRAGLYDKVHGTISYSYSDSAFVAGPVLDKPLDFVKWIWGNGRQWFDTRVWGKSGLKSEVDVGIREYSGDHAILSCRGTTGDMRFYMAYHYESAFRYAYGKLPEKTHINVVAPTNDVLTSTHLDVRYVIKTDLQDGYQSVTVSRNGGEPVELHKEGEPYLTGEIATTNTLYLLANNKMGTPTCASKCLIYATKIWDGDELLRDFVPVVATNSSGVAYAGLYDRVAERVYRQIGTAEFDVAAGWVGAVTNTLRVVSRPKTRIDYVVSDGDYDYVDLGVMANAGLEMETTMDWVTIPSERGLLGARSFSYVDGNNDPVRFFPYSTYSVYESGKLVETQHAYHYNHTRWTARDSGDSPVPIVKDVTYKIASRLDQGAQSITVWERGAGGGWNHLGTRSISDAPNVVLGLPLHLFAINEDGQYRYPVKARCRGLKLGVKQQDGTYKPVRDLVPVKDPVTGGAALWDNVTETYFRNSNLYLLAGGGAERPFDSGMTIIVR
ncbi:MAG: hypothetical protein IJI36_14455 [Kiritimatiellae bacterium]|nr:hypothetical protein [Kiritimatiellia bacterium]